MEPSTRDLLVEFMDNHLSKRGLRLPPVIPSARNGRGRNQSSLMNRSKEYRKFLNEICQSLNEMSSELHEFISNAYNDKFRESIEIIDVEYLDFEGLDRLADTLFSPDIAWFHILTFLHYGAELVCKGIEVSEFKGYNHQESYNMVYCIIEWMCKYIDTKLLDWIEEQGGWMSINSFREHENKHLKQRYNALLGMAAFAVVTGGLYLCSKFTGQ